MIRRALPAAVAAAACLALTACSHDGASAGAASGFFGSSAAAATGSVKSATVTVAAGADDWKPCGNIHRLAPAVAYDLEVRNIRNLATALRSVVRDVDTTGLQVSANVKIAAAAAIKTATEALNKLYSDVVPAEADVVPPLQSMKALCAREGF